MRIIKAIAAIALASLTAIACGATPDAQEGTAGSSDALSSSGGTCSTDSSCRSGLVCDLYCPLLPNHLQCHVYGGTCQSACSRAASSLEGEVFTSADGVESLTFTSGTTFTKSVGCATTGGITCHHVVLSQGTYISNGTKITLTTTTGVKDTVTVKPHCYDGLFDTAQNEELYLAGSVPLACGPSIGKSCPTGSSCEGLPLPSSGLIGGSGTCGTAPLCDPNAETPCPSGLECVGTDLKHYGACQPVAHGESVGAGYACGASIGISCVTGLNCIGTPLASSGLVGGSGLCSAATGCDPNTNLACGSALECVAVDTKHGGSCAPFAHGATVGKGYACGGSIGVACAAGLTCAGLPTGVVGGTGSCQ